MLPWLSVYPDHQKAILLIEGFSQGFKIPKLEGICCEIVRNLVLVDNLASIVKTKLLKEIDEGRMSGPFAHPSFDNLRISPLWIIPKRDPREYSLVHHLSYRYDNLVNDQIDPTLSSVSYVSFDTAVVKLRSIGEGVLLANANIKSAFRLLPIHPDCFCLLGIYF